MSGWLGFATAPTFVMNSFISLLDENPSAFFKYENSMPNILYKCKIRHYFKDLQCPDYYFQKHQSDSIYENVH